MIKIVKNHGQVSVLKDKYILRAYSELCGEYVYAKVRIKPLIFYFTYRFKYHRHF